MSQGPAEEQGFLKRRVPLKWLFIAVAAMVVIMAAVIVAVVMVNRERDEDRRAAAAAATAATAVTSPYDFSELPADTDLESVEDAAFISVFLLDDQGELTSFGISADLPAAQALSKAIRDADQLDPETGTSVTAAADDEAAAEEVAPSTITFVFPDRDTLTFVLDLAGGTIARGERVWKPDGDLRTLIDDALAGNR